MNKRKTRKAAYQAIVKEKKMHQEIFDELRETSSLDTNTLATEVSKIPSNDKHQNQQVLIYIFVGALVLVIGVRSIGVIAMLIDSNFDSITLLIGVLAGTIIPIIGIIGALTARVEMYKTVSILLTISLVRIFSEGNISLEPITMLLIPFVAAIALAFYIPTRLKTSFTTKTIKKEIDGKTTTRVEYVFDTTKLIVNDELLDENMLD